MAWTSTLSELQTEVRERGGYRRSLALTPTILTRMINKGIAKVHEFIVKHNPGFIAKLASPDLLTTPGSASVALPGDFYALWGRPLLVRSGRTLKIQPYDIDEEGDFEDLALFGYDGVGYRSLLQAGNLRLAPVPTVVDTIRLWYLPHATKLVNPGDVYDGQNGHEDLIIEWALRFAAEKDRRPSGDHQAAIGELEVKLLSALEARDQSAPDYLFDHGRGWPVWEV